jgi:hypothetical protein
VYSDVLLPYFNNLQKDPVRQGQQCIISGVTVEAVADIHIVMTKLKIISE